MSSEPVPTHSGDPIALARDNWARAGWGEVADGMVAVEFGAHGEMYVRLDDFRLIAP